MYSASTFVSNGLHVASEPVSQQLYLPLFDGTLFFIETLSNNVRPWTLFDIEFLLTQKTSLLHGTTALHGGSVQDLSIIAVLLSNP